MTLRIPVAHDFICPWCWVGLLQSKRLKAEFGVEFDWLGYELYPEELEWPLAVPAPPPPANKPPVPSRFDLILAADGITMPAVVRPRRMRTFFAHQAVEFAKVEGTQDAVVEKLYRALFEEGLEINKPEVLLNLGTGIIQDLAGYEEAILERKFRDMIVKFDDDAHANGIYNVPTFFIGSARYAEQPYVVLQKAVADWIATQS